MSFINKEIACFQAQACQLVHEYGVQVCPAKWQPGLDLAGALSWRSR